MIQNKNHFIQSYRFEKEPTENKSLQYQIEFCKFLIPKNVRYFLAKLKNKNKCSIIKKIMYENRVTKVLHLKKRNWTVVLIFTRYSTYCFICCAIHSTVWWLGVKCTNNLPVAQKDLWLRTVRLVQQNNDRVIYFYILWCKNVTHLNKKKVTWRTCDFNPNVIVIFHNIALNCWTGGRL